MSESTCPICVASFDPLQGRYAPDGRVVCVSCGERLAREQLSVQKKSAGSAFVGAIGAVLIALMSLVMQVRGIFFAMPLLALAFGLGTAYTALFHQEAKDALGWKRVPTIVIGTIAVLIAVLSLVSTLVVM